MQRDVSRHDLGQKVKGSSRWQLVVVQDNFHRVRKQTLSERNETNRWRLIKITFGRSNVIFVRTVFSLLFFFFFLWFESVGVCLLYFDGKQTESMRVYSPKKGVLLCNAWGFGFRQAFCHFVGATQRSFVSQRRSECNKSIDKLNH